MERYDGPRILVVDDEVDLINVFKDLFSQRGESIDTAGTGEEAVEKLQSGNYEVIISDINLPGINGLEVLRVAKRENPDACVIMITGFASASSAITALREGAYDYITKPFADSGQGGRSSQAGGREQAVGPGPQGGQCEAPVAGGAPQGGGREGHRPPVYAV
jgi:CheY-like chemotaxis protein